MANLISPGVSATIVDESFFIPGRVTTLPLIFIATAEEKLQEDDETPALGTFEHNVYREVTSIRQSIELYGIPRYMESLDGDPHHGDARNEYGLDALNKFLEIGNRAYVIRANVNLDDRLEQIRFMWDRKIVEAGGYLVELINDYIDEYNAVNDLLVGDSGFKTTVTDEEFREILSEALIDVFDTYSFSSKNRTGDINMFAEDFLSDHTITRSAFQEVIFDTDPGFLTTDDTTSLESGTTYGATIQTNSGDVDVTLDGSQAETFGDLIDELNTQMSGVAEVELISGRLRITADSTGVSSTIEILDGNPSGTEELFSSLTLYEGLSDSEDGTAGTPLPIYMNGFDEISTDDYDGLYALIDQEPSGEFSATDAEQLLLNAASEYAYTQEFRTHTSLGSTDQERRDEIVTSLKAAINNPNLGIRNPDAFNYNLVACPGYKEVGTELLRLAEDMLNEVFVMGETPMNKPPTGFNGVSAWATNSSERQVDPGIAYWYPHGLSSNIDGKDILTTSSATALRVFAFNDRERNLWWAPAGTQRGQCNHLSEIGYVSGTLGGPTAFVEDQIDLGARDSLYEFPKNINPISRITGRGILVMGQKTSSPVVSARESINVERLLRFIKRELRRGVFPFLFEPNDQITRNQVKSTVDNFLVGLLNNRALYDFATICDETNNTPDRIDRKELWIDVALKPVRAVEFIYVPIRVVATGAEIGSNNSVEELPQS